MNVWKLRITVHASWLIATACLGVTIGVIGARHVPAGLFSSMMWLMTAIVLLCFGFWRRRRYVMPIILIAGGLVGVWRGSITYQQLAPYEKLVGHQLTIVGRVGEDADLGKAGELILHLRVREVERHPLSGTVWVSLPRQVDIKRGDIVTVRGKLASGFGGFSGSIYRASLIKAERPQPGDVARRVRDQFADDVRAAVPEPQASLGLGYLVGQRRALPVELSEALQIAGLTHVIVASGYNLTILVRLARRLFVKVSKYLAAVAAGAMIIAFMAITGMSPSMSRAGLVAGLGLLAWYYGRKFHPLALLLFAAAVTVLVNPSYGWSDLGWQLSFAAFAGVMIVAPLGQRFLFGDQKPGLLRQILGETISAQLVTLPLLVLAFGQFSNVAVIANLLILPLVPLAMLLTFAAGIGAMLLPLASGIIGMPASMLLQYMTVTATYFGHVSWAQSKLTIGYGSVIGYYIVLAAICLYVWRKTRYNLRDSNIVE